MYESKEALLPKLYFYYTIKKETEYQSPLFFVNKEK